MYSPSGNSPSPYFISLPICHTQCIDIPVLAVSRLFAHKPSYWPYLPVEFPVAQWSSICSSYQKNIGLTPVKKTHIIFISIPLFHSCILMDIDGDNTCFAPFAVLCARFHSFFCETSFERLPYRPTLMSQILKHNDQITVWRFYDRFHSLRTLPTLSLEVHRFQ